MAEGRPKGEVEGAVLSEVEGKRKASLLKAIGGSERYALGLSGTGRLRNNSKPHKMMEMSIFHRRYV